MSEDQDYSALYLHFGTNSPYWRLGTDSDAISLSAIRDEIQITVGLTPEQAEHVRSLTGITSSLTIDVRIFDDDLKLHLVGRKNNANEWAGTASAYGDTDSVARDLVEGLSFAESVVSEANSVIVIVDQAGRIQRFNRLAEEYTNKREQDIIGKSAFELFMSPEEAAASRRNISGFYRNGSSYEAERLINTVKGKRLFLFRNKFVRSGSGKKQNFLICSGTDITEERQARERLRILANTDVLTGLPNRYAINELLNTSLKRGQEKRLSLGVLFLDLDDFKRVNDHYGHPFGDKLLRLVSTAIASCLSDDQILGRFGGDEFIVLQENASIESLEATAQRILGAMRLPFRQGLIEVYTSCSIGIAMYPDHGEDAESLIRSADIAMYAAKEMGRRTCKVFAADMDQRVADSVWLDTNLRKALAEGQLQLYYQPKLSAKTGAVFGVEALVRWISPEHGTIAPSAFIPYAEESGLISPLGGWVMEEAARQAVIWRDKGLSLRVAINVSARQLVDNASMGNFMDALGAASLHPCSLDIELTESCLIEDEVTAIKAIRQFRQLGAEVHMDDFGTGYSSLSQLARIPLDAIKLDAHFVRDINKKPVSQAIARAIVAVAKALRLKVIAEGVENHSEESFLQTLDVDQVQGYLYARPMPAAELELWLQQRQRLQITA
ncbi:cyclic di-GMP phosphodiesterase [Alcaligenaceae bacterium]|nr:cyclic di-GMP phosphodiesterase [Alcaligenaceae bacterium]